VGRNNCHSAGYNHVTAPDKRIRAGCNSHARRKFVDVDHDEARHVIELYKEVFAAEHEAAERNIVGTSAHLALRRARAGPAMRAIKHWCDQHLKDFTPKSPMGKAIKYFRNQWEYLRRFLDHADIAPHNNLSERMLRLIALGRKNYLFVGHEQGGTNLAMLCSLIETCRLHRVNPQVYLADILLRVQDHPQKKIGELAPDRWKALFDASD
jgi:transposase